MRRFAALLVPLVLVSACATSGGNTGPGQQPGERLATKSEIETAATGQSFASGMAYGSDGRFTFKGANPGTYRIYEGKICVTFVTGKSRCDRILTDGSSFVLVDRRGKRYPFS